MAPTPSGHLRKKLGLYNAQMKKKLADVPSLTTVVPGETIPEQRNRLENVICQAHMFTDRLGVHLAHYKELDAEWSQILTGLIDAGAANEAAEEEKLYDTHAVSGYLLLIDEAEDKCSQLRTKSLEATRLKAELDGTRNSSNAGNTSDNNDLGAGRAPTHEQEYKLPQIRIPTFDGEPLQWLTFWDLYEDIIHKRKDMSDIKKLQHLKALLTGRARIVTDGVSVGGAGYKEAITRLHSQFGDKKHVTNALLAGLSALPVAQDNVRSLRGTLDKADQVLGQLISIGNKLDEDTDDLARMNILNMVLRKLPDEVNKELQIFLRASGATAWTATSLRKSMWEILDIRESVYQIKDRPTPRGDGASVGPSGGRKGQRQQKRWGNGGGGGAHERTAVFAVQASTKSTERLCCFCGKNHFSAACLTHKSLAERRRIFSTKRLCFKCTRPGHMSKNCPTGTQACFYCKETWHNQALCPTKFGDNQSRPNKKQQAVSATVTVQIAPQIAPAITKQSGTAHVVSTTLQAGRSKKKGVVMTAYVDVSSSEVGSKTFKALVLLDPGAGVNFITEELFKKLRPPVSGRETIAVYGFNSAPYDLKSKCTQVYLHSQNHSPYELECYTVPRIVQKTTRALLAQSDLDAIGKLPGNVVLNETVMGAAAKELKPDILLSIQDYFELELPGERIRLPSGLRLVPTKMGMILCGAEDRDKLGPVQSLVVCTENGDPDETMSFREVANPSQEDYSHMWKLSSIGITDDPDNDDDAIAMAKVMAKLDISDDCITTGWPWIDDKPDLKANYGLALGRFKSAAKKYAKDPELLRETTRIIEDQLAKGVIEVAPEIPTGLEHYVPYHVVKTPKKTTTNYRVVYDGSAKANPTDKSLNECFYRGPVILPDLIYLLINFRFHKYGILSDVEKAFLQLWLHEWDRDCTRFIWFKDPSKYWLFEGNMVIMRFTRVCFGMKPSSFLLASGIAAILKYINTPVALKLFESLYVDNSVSGTDTEDGACDFYKESKGIFKRWRMNLREYSTNSPKLRACLDECDKAKGDVVKVLGLLWDTIRDTLTIGSLEDIGEETKVTKRAVLRAVSTIFDPFGAMAPITLEGRTLLQKMWLDKLAWDDAAGQQYQQEFEELRAKLAHIGDIQMPRWIPVTEKSECQLHVYADASAKAYAAVAYLRIEDETIESGQVQQHLLICKHHLAPIPKEGKKALSIPRLELLGATLAALLIEQLIGNLKLPCAISKSFLHCDSQIVAHWVRDCDRCGVFVQNRVLTIRRCGATMRWIATDDNPADLATRGTTVDELKSSDLWWHGAHSIRLHEDEWPTSQVKDLTPEDVASFQLELRRAENKVELAMAVVTSKVKEPLVNVNRFATRERLIRVTVLVLRFIKQRLCDRSDKARNRLQRLAVFHKGLISTFELNEAESFIERSVQKEYYADEIDILFKRRTDYKNVKCNELIKAMNLHLNESDLLVCAGRLTNAASSYKARYPVLLPKGSHYTKLVVRQVHEKLCHAGVQTTMATVRNSYWVPSLRQLVKQYVHWCAVCRRATGGPYVLPPMPQLPVERIEKREPFKNVGIDYFGPIMVKANSGQNGQTHKVWACLVTCLATRAVHLELAPDLTARSFLGIMRLFIARRGKPDLVICDNAPQFKLTAKALALAWKEVTSSDEVMNYCASERIEFREITPFAPWEGGFYERLVGMVKRTLKKGIGRRLLTEREFTILLVEQEPIVNSRPLTYLYEDKGSYKVLRPADFLTPGRFTGTVMFGRETDNDDDPDWRAEHAADYSSAERLRDFYRSLSHVRAKVWDLFYSEYMGSMRERAIVAHQRPRGSLEVSIAVDHVVLIDEEPINRGAWRVGRVKELKLSDDGEVRSAVVELPNGKVLHRSIKLLYPFEMTAGQDSVDQNHATVDAKASDEKKDDDGEPSDVDPEDDQNPSSKGEDSRQDKDEQEGNTPKVRRSPRLAKLGNRVVISALMVMVFYVRVVAAVGSLVPGMCQTDFMGAVVDSEICRQIGHVIYSIKNTEKFCWKQVDCGMGQALDGVGGCAKQVPECKCPDWTTKCVPIAHPNTDTEEVRSVMGKVKPDICSFEPDTRCSDTPTVRTLARVELPNGERHFVKHLEIGLTETLPEEYKCVGNGEKTGTPEFCANNECKITGTKLCYYKRYEKATFIDGNGGKVALKAWGYESVTVYQEKSTANGKPRDSVSCAASCAVGGISVTMEAESSMAQVCVKPACYNRPFPGVEETFLFGSDITTREHEAKVTIWKGGVVIKDMTIVCSAQPFCEQVNCIFCKTMLQNPHCAPRGMLVLLFVIAYFATFFLYWTSKVLTCLARCGYYCGWGCYGCYRIMKKCKRATGARVADAVYVPLYAMATDQENIPEERDVESGGRGYQRLTYNVGADTVVMVTVCLLSLIQPVSTCAHTETVDVEATSCRSRGDEMFCKVTKATQLSLAPEGQKACMLVTGMGKHPLATLDIEAKDIKLKCQKRTQYFTRSYQGGVSASKRCPGAGSCTGTICQETKPTSMIKELEGVANDHPGFSYCEDSPSCWAEGCFRCDAACLFYRTFVMPTSETLYEVFDCPVWEQEVTLNLELHKNGKSESTTLTVIPGSTVSWKQVKIAIPSVALPTAPKLLSSSFITDSRGVAMVQASESGQPVAGTIGSLQCAAKADAISFERCYTAMDSCTCTPRFSTAACTCAELDLETVFTNAEMALPIDVGGIVLSPSGDSSVHAKMHRLTNLKVQISMKGMELRIKDDLNQCKASIGEATGCYSCLTGAELSVECKSDVSTTIAHVRCKNFAFGVKCSPKGEVQKRVVHANSALIDEQCDVSCSGKTSQVQVKGTLAFVGHHQLGRTTSIISDTGGNGSFDWQSIMNLGGLHWTMILAVVLLALLAAVLTLTCVMPVCLQYWMIGPIKRD